jgi:hypothetical protein
MSTRGTPSSHWTVDNLAFHLFAMLAERDLRYQQRFDAQNDGVDKALAAAKEAVTKSEIADQRRFEGVNEFRATLADQAATLMPRNEAEARFAALAEKIDANSHAIASIRGGEHSKAVSQSTLFTVLGLVLAAMSIIAVVVLNQ